MLKNLGRFKQASERLGGAKAILQTEDIQELENQTEQWHEGFERMYRSVKKAYAELAHRKQTTTAQETTVKPPPLHAIGDSWTRHGNEIAKNSPKLGMWLCDALKRLGEAEIEISAQMERVTVQLNDSYLQLLRDSRKCYDEYREIRKKLEMRRLDYAANLGRLQKAKKEKPQLEQILQQSRIKYEETENDLLQHMMLLDDYKEKHRKALKNFLDIQLDSYMNAVSTLKNLQSSWPDGLEEDEDEHSHDNEDLMMPIAKKRISSDSAYERSSTTSAKPAAATSGNPDHSHEATAGSILTSAYPPPPSITSYCADHKSAASTSDYSADCNSIRSNYSERTAEFRRKPSTVPSLHSARRKAIFDFKGEHPEDLSLKTGDIITVLEEINQGWWLGEVSSKNGEKMSGIFPVNYTEAFDTCENPPPLPAKDSHLLQEASIRQHARSSSKH
ncbi:hypothetical protein BX666DRAFT_2030185 [Dichotomocladium elegans]|nr:hypothetical protein BX666DRAFT_2030185 [Dichotomocladium elegans]